MPDFSSLQSKVNALKAMVAANSISPTYLGTLLDDFILLVSNVDASVQGNTEKTAELKVDLENILQEIQTNSSGITSLSELVEKLEKDVQKLTADFAEKPAEAYYADEAGHAATADYSDEAAHAAEADHAAKADESDHAAKADEAEHAVEADHAASAADLDADSPVRKQFLSRLDDDTAAGIITFLKVLLARGGAEFGEYVVGDMGASIDAEGNGELETLWVRRLLRAAKAICPDIIGESISTEMFSDGFAGSGFRIWKDGEGVTHMTVDTLTVRQMMTVFELLIARIRSIGGMLFVSAANGKVKSAQKQPDGSWAITFEDAKHGFISGDYMRCATFCGSASKAYWVRVATVSAETVTVPANQWQGQSIPEAGDEVVLCGSENKLRQSGILISATEDGQPRIEILDGISGKTFAGCLRVRLGYLDDIVDEENFPGKLKPKGNGIYSDNAYFKGEFVLSGSDGGSIRTLLTVMDGRITSEVSDLESRVSSSIEQTAGEIRSEVSDIKEGLESSITQTAEGIRSEVKDKTDDLYAAIEQTAEGIRTEVKEATDAQNERISSLEITAEGLQSSVTELSDGLEQANSTITQTAGAIRSEVEALEGRVNSTIEQTAESITAAVEKKIEDGDNALDERIGKLEISADGIRSEVSDVKKEQDSLKEQVSTIEQTAAGISSKVSDIEKAQGSLEGRVSKVEQTAEGIRSEVDAITDNQQTLDQRISSVEQTADGISISVSRLEGQIDNANDDIVDLNTRIDITAAGIVSTVEDKERGLKSEISQSAEAIIAAVGETGIDIENGKITLNGDTEFVGSDGETVAMFADGKINAAMLDADSLTARRVEVQYPDTRSKCVTILPSDKGMRIYDEDGGLVQQLSGIRHDNPINAFYGGSLSGGITLTKSNGSSIYQGIEDRFTSYDWQSVAISNVIDSQQVLRVLFTDGTISVTASTQSDEVNYFAYGQIQLVLEQLDDSGEVVNEITIADATAVANYASVQNTTTTQLAGKMGISVSAGRYRLAVQYAANMIKGSVTVRWMGLKVEHAENVYSSNFFANGYLLGAAVDNYVAAYNSATEGMVYESRMGEYGVKMSRAGVRMLQPDGTWSLTPMLLYKGVFSAAADVQKLSSDGYYGINPAVSVSGSRLYIYFPEEWKTLRGGADKFFTYLSVRAYTYNISSLATCEWMDNIRACVNFTNGIVPTDIEIYIR